MRGIIRLVAEISNMPSSANPRITQSTQPDKLQPNQPSRASTVQRISGPHQLPSCTNCRCHLGPTTWGKGSDQSWDFSWLAHAVAMGTPRAAAFWALENTKPVGVSDGLLNLKPSWSQLVPACLLRACRLMCMAPCHYTEMEQVRGNHQSFS